MKNLQEKIKILLKETSEKKDKLKNTISTLINKNGIYQTIKLMGGYESFIEMVPDYFSDKKNKVDLINDTVLKEGGETSEYNAIFLYDIPPEHSDLHFNTEKSEDGTITYEEYIVYIKHGKVKINVYDFDEDGEMISDEPFDRFERNLNGLDNQTLNLIFEKLVNYYLE